MVVKVSYGAEFMTFRGKEIYGKKKEKKKKRRKRKKIKKKSVVNYFLTTVDIVL